MNLEQLKNTIDLYNTGNLPERDTAHFLVYLFNENLFEAFHPKFKREFEIYCEQKNIFVLETGNAVVNDRVFPVEPEPEKLTLKEVTKKTVLEVGSYALDEFLSELFKTQFEFEAAEELGDGDIREFDVEPEQMDPDDVKDIESNKYNWVGETANMLNHACYLGLIEPGEYSVHNRM